MILTSEVLKCPTIWPDYETPKFNMVHLKMSPWKFGDSELSYWKPSFSGSMLNFGGVNEIPHDSPFPNLVPQEWKDRAAMEFLQHAFWRSTHFFVQKARVFFFWGGGSDK